MLICSVRVRPERSWVYGITCDFVVPGEMIRLGARHVDQREPG